MTFSIVAKCPEMKFWVGSVSLVCIWGCMLGKSWSGGSGDSGYGSY